MAALGSGVNENTYQVRKIHDGILETIFNVLPTPEKERRKGQENRRKYKDKIQAEHRDVLIVDSSYSSDEGNPTQSHTNTILMTSNLDWWQDNILQTYAAKYKTMNKELSGGHQTTFKKDAQGNKFLSFSFYPTKSKLMVQGRTT